MLLFGKTVIVNFQNFFIDMKFHNKTIRAGMCAICMISCAGVHPAFAQSLADVSKNLDSTTQAFSLGVRWDLARHWAVKVQYDMLSTPDATTPGTFKVRHFPFNNSAQLLTASLDVVF